MNNLILNEIIIWNDKIEINDDKDKKIIQIMKKINLKEDYGQLMNDYNEIVDEKNKLKKEIKGLKEKNDEHLKLN